MAKDYLGGIVDLTGDSYLNPSDLLWSDNEGSHGRSVSQITSISIHHDAQERPHDYDSVLRYKNEAALHYQTLGKGLQYHYKIDNTGVIFKIRPLTTWLNCVGSAENVSTLAICLDGYFHAPYNQTPTREQYEALGQLLVSLCENHPEFPATYPDVRPHRDFSSTACPGDLFAPWVLAIQSKADVLNIPADATYDWPTLQSSVETPATPAVETPLPSAVQPATPVPVVSVPVASTPPATPPTPFPAPAPPVDTIQPSKDSQLPQKPNTPLHELESNAIQLATTTLGQLLLGIISTGLATLATLLTGLQADSKLVFFAGLAINAIHGVANFIDSEMPNLPKG